MINQMKPPIKKDFDVIVAGSGPGGATVARELTASGFRVLILEWGDNNPVKGTIAQTIPRAFIPGKSLFITGQFLSMVRAITTGGSSLIYCATAFDPPFEMLRKYGIEISREVGEIRKEIPNAPLTDELMSPSASLFEKSALDLGYDCRRLDKFVYQEKCRPDCTHCLYGCPFGAKWSARDFADDAVKNGAVLINYAKVTKVLIEDGRAVGVEYRKGGGSHKAFASKIVISAGGIGSPLILKESGIKDAGKDFFFDPLIYVYGKIRGLKSGFGLSMSAGIHFPDDGIVMTDFSMPHLLKALFDIEALKPGRAFSYSNVMPVMIKVRDGLSGRIINDRLIWKKLSGADRLKLDVGAGRAGRILENAGATDIYRSWVLAAHPGGTVKIGEHLDSNLKTRFDNLYVCDCSVIPEEWGLPPTMTLLGLGKRLASHLAGTENNKAGGHGPKPFPPSEIYTKEANQ